LHRSKRCKQLKSWWNVCTQTKEVHVFWKTRPPRRSIVASSTRADLSMEKEAEAQTLAQRIRELADDEIVQMARLLVSKSDRDIFGDTEFQLRDIVLKVGAKALEEHLRQKKTATTAAVSIVRTVPKRRNSKGIVPRRR
jgi:hypothetical protein